MTDDRHDRSHYSYTVYERDEVAEGFEPLRFGGPIGVMFREHQEQLLEVSFPDVAHLRILDLGAGTGRTSIPLSRRGARVVSADASFPMLRVAMNNARRSGAAVAGVRADAHRLPFRDSSFDVVICFRMIMHVVDWRVAVAEICRLAATAVMIDFPPKCGFAGFAPWVHPLLRLIRKDHQSYRVFKEQEISDELTRNGFDVQTVDRHVVLPFGLHRAIGSPAFTRTIESLFRSTGLTGRFGAPVTVTALRRQA